MKQHVNEKRIESVFENRLEFSSEEKQHIEQCPSCRSLVDQEQRLDAILRGLKAQKAPRGLLQKVLEKASVRNNGRDWWFVAAAFSLAVLSGYYIFTSNPIIAEIFSAFGLWLSPIAEKAASYLPKVSFGINISGGLPFNVNLLLAGVLAFGFFMMLDRFWGRRFRH